MFVDLLRMYLAAFPHKLQDRECAVPPPSRGRHKALSGNASIGPRVHERLHFAGYEAVIDEKVLFDPQFSITPFQIPGPVILHPVPQDQVLRPSWCANGICLHESHSLQGTFQGCGLKQTAANGEPPQILRRDRHSFDVIESFGAPITLQTYVRGLSPIPCSLSPDVTIAPYPLC